eukprot:SAG31_NODE_7452_length_1686_cov_1.144297_1_plen_44_part_10
MLADLPKTLHDRLHDELYMGFRKTAFFTLAGLQREDRTVVEELC